MLQPIQRFHDYVQHFNDVPSESTRDLLLVGSPIPVWIITILYMLFVFLWGPNYMSKRPAYNIKKLLLIYNVFQIVLNMWVGLTALQQILKHRPYELGCTDRLPTDHPLKPMEIRLFHIYYLLKYVDYFDTVFFVLRKSFKQISFLHVYHHLLLVNATYFYLRYYGTGGPLGMIILLNSFVHGVMYAYYFFAALKPDMKKSIWWKKYITLLQLVQFVIVFAHHLYPLIFRSDCAVPKLRLIFGTVQAIIMIWLFGNFYVKSYYRPVMSAAKSKSK